MAESGSASPKDGSTATTLTTVTEISLAIASMLSCDDTVPDSLDSREDPDGSTLVRDVDKIEGAMASDWSRTTLTETQSMSKKLYKSRRTSVTKTKEELEKDVKLKRQAIDRTFKMMHYAEEVRIQTPSDGMLRR